MRIKEHRHVAATVTGSGGAGKVRHNRPWADQRKDRSRHIPSIRQAHFCSGLQFVNGVINVLFVDQSIIFDYVGFLQGIAQQLIRQIGTVVCISDDGGQDKRAIERSRRSQSLEEYHSKIRPASGLRGFDEPGLALYGDELARVRFARQLSRYHGGPDRLVELSHVYPAEDLESCALSIW